MEKIANHLTVGELRKIINDPELPDDMNVITCECNLGTKLVPEEVPISYVHVTTVGIISDDFETPTNALLIAGPRYGVDSSYLAKLSGHSHGKVYF